MNRIARNLFAKPILAGLALAFVGGSAVCRAEDQPSSLSTPSPSESKSAQERLLFGLETDVLPYALHGYYAGGFLGRGGWRVRGVVEANTAPSFQVASGFEDKRSDTYALLVDRFIGRRRNNLQGFTADVGVEYLRNRIRTTALPATANYHDFVLTAGGGYVWKVSRHVYLNPWAAGSFVVAGQRRIPVSGQTYKQPIAAPEASVKIGIVF